MSRKTKKKLSGQVRVDPDDQAEAIKIQEIWNAAKTGRISMKDFFRAGVRHFQQELQGA